MKLSSQEEYGLRCLLQVARQGEGRSLTLSDLARLEGISPANAAKFMRVLRRAGFLKSTRGQAGGYALARPAAQIVVADVLAALGGRMFDSTFCGRHAGASSLCAHLGDCSIRPVLVQLQVAIDLVLAKLTIGQLLCNEREMQSRTPRSMSLPIVEVRTA